MEEGEIRDSPPPQGHQQRAQVRTCFIAMLA
jgi:hypothetical protein